MMDLETGHAQKGQAPQLLCWLLLCGSVVSDLVTAAAAANKPICWFSDYTFNCSGAQANTDQQLAHCG